MSPVDLSIAALAAVAAGVINALAGGGTLISFPVLVAVGVSPIAANITNAIALSPGYLGATIAQRAHLSGQRARLLLLLPIAVIGGLAGGVILLRTRERTFTTLVPWLILLASVLLAVQEPMKKFIGRRLSSSSRKHEHRGLAVVAIAAAAIYGGFFSAGMSVLLLAILGLSVDDTLTRLNALKQALAFATNVAAAVFFLFSAQVVWPAVAVMAVGSLLGGALGGKLVGTLSPAVLRRTVVIAGISIASAYWLKSA